MAISAANRPCLKAQCSTISNGGAENKDHILKWKKEWRKPIKQTP